MEICDVGLLVVHDTWCIIMNLSDVLKSLWIWRYVMSVCLRYMIHDILSWALVRNNYMKIWLKSGEADLKSLQIWRYVMSECVSSVMSAWFQLYDVTIVMSACQMMSYWVIYDWHHADVRLTKHKRLIADVRKCDPHSDGLMKFPEFYSYMRPEVVIRLPHSPISGDSPSCFGCTPCWIWDNCVLS